MSCHSSLDCAVTSMTLDRPKSTQGLALQPEAVMNLPGDAEARASRQQRHCLGLMMHHSTNRMATPGEAVP